MSVRRPASGVAWLAALLAGAGLVLVAQGLWIPAKAWLAQRLIARAWHDTLAGQPDRKPWPWADTWPVAALELPGSTRPLYVLSGATGQSLAFGPAHVTRSAPPGSDDNVVFAGHRDTHFRALEDLASGDRIRVVTPAGRRTYQVEGSAVVHESRVDLLERSGRAELTLITCYPFGAIVPGGPLRYVVFARATSEHQNPLARHWPPTQPTP